MHALHEELILALLVGVTLVLALPWKVELGLAALVERDEEVCALVPEQWSFGATEAQYNGGSVRRRCKARGAANGVFGGDKCGEVKGS
ncbi:hypothetical protein AAHE18_01G095400 [Arachis hypogaea]